MKMNLENSKQTNKMKARCIDSRLDWFGQTGLIKNCIEEGKESYSYIMKFGKKLVELHESQVEVL